VLTVLTVLTVRKVAKVFKLVSDNTTPLLLTEITWVRGPLV
jgi:hypothetical protein